MDGLKGFAEVAKHILYETFGLLIPGGILALVVALMSGPDTFAAALRFGDAHPWLATTGAYVLGYPVQALSRPLTTAFEWILLLPFVAFRAVARSVIPEAGYRWIATRLTRFRGALTGRHSHKLGDRSGGEADAVLELMRSYWAGRLGLADAAALSTGQLRDLSFSEVQAARDRLDRFRAAASLARGVATTVVIVVIALAYQLAVGDRQPTWELAFHAMLLIIAFSGLMERADMYDRLWHSVLRSQFLCAASQERPLGPGVSAAVLPAQHGSNAHAAISAAAVPPLGVKREHEEARR
jgi:hypothetical protein